MICPRCGNFSSRSVHNPGLPRFADPSPIASFFRHLVLCGTLSTAQQTPMPGKHCITVYNSSQQCCSINSTAKKNARVRKLGDKLNKNKKTEERTEQVFLLGRGAEVACHALPMPLPLPDAQNPYKYVVLSINVQDTFTWKQKLEVQHQPRQHRCGQAPRLLCRSIPQEKEPYNILSARGPCSSTAILYITRVSLFCGHERGSLETGGATCTTLLQLQTPLIQL